MYKYIALAVVLGVVAQIDAFYYRDHDSECCCSQPRYRVLQVSQNRPEPVTEAPQELHTIKFYLPAPQPCTTKAPPVIKLPEIKCPPPILPLQEPIVLPPSCVCFETGKCEDF